MSNLKSVQVSKGRLCVVVTASVLTAIVIVGLSQLEWEVVTETPQERPATTKTINLAAIKLANEQLEWARSESLERLDGHFAAIDELFRQVRTREFAERALSWESKWLLVKDQFTGSKEHARYISSAFRVSVLDSAELQRLLQQCTAAYQQELNSIDGEFYVRAQLDVEELPESESLVSGTDDNSLDHMRIIQGAISASEADLPETIVREAVSWAVSEVVSSVLLSLGTATGMVSEQDAKSGWKPFVTNVGVGLAVDKAITDATDPVGKLQAVVNRQLAGLRTAVLEGSPDVPGVLPRLRACAEARSEARRAAAQSLVPGMTADSTSKLSF